MQSPRKLMVTLVACGLGLGVLGGAQVNTAMKPGPDMPFRWADGTLKRAPSMQFAESVPLELDVPDDFQLATAVIDGDPASGARALGHEPRGDWAALQLSAYKVDAPARLPDITPEWPTGGAEAALTLAGNDPAGDNLDFAPQPGNPVPDEDPAEPLGSG